MILLLFISVDENFVVEEDCVLVELIGSVVLLDGVLMIIGYGVEL